MSCIPAKAGDGIDKIQKQETAIFFIANADVMVEIAYSLIIRTRSAISMWGTVRTQLILNNLEKVHYISLTHPTRSTITLKRRFICYQFQGDHFEPP